MVTVTTVPPSGTVGALSDNSSFYDLNCLLPFNHSKDLPSFDTAAVVSRVTFAILLSILILPTLFLNITVLIAILRNRDLWRSSHILIGLLAVTDALVGILSMPLLLSTVLMEIFYKRSSYDRQVYCIIGKAALNAGDLGMGWSFITISLMTFERYVAIFAPFWYRKYVHTSVVVKIAIVIWLIWAAVVGVLVLKTPAQFVIGIVILILVVLVYFLALPAFIRIFYFLKKMESNPLPETNSRPVIDRKGSITCAVMLLCLTVCYTPLIVVSITSILNGLTTTLITYLLPWSRLILLANSFFNPIIYICRNPLIQKSATNIFKRFCVKKANSQPVEVTGVPIAPAILNCGISNKGVITTKL